VTRKKILCTGPTRAAKAGQKYWHDEPNEPTKEGYHSYVPLESPFASVSTVDSLPFTILLLVKIGQVVRKLTCMGQDQ
jgi:hypothetical protein